MRQFCLGFFLSAVLVVPNVASADPYADGAAAALAQQNGTINDLVQMELSTRTQVALNAMVQEATQALADNGHADEAKQLQQEWDDSFSGYFMTFQLDNLGDHQPLNAWLADFYKKLLNELGKPILQLLHLDDLNTMNYAVPVVFQPKGDKRNGDHWDQAEYSRHFVPFSEVLVYWSSYVGCEIAAHGVPFKKYCGVAAVTLKNLTGSLMAPKLSKFVYAKMTNEKNATFIADYDSFNTTAQQKLSQIPQN